MLLNAKKKVPVASGGPVAPPISEWIDTATYLDATDYTVSDDNVIAASANSTSEWVVSAMPLYGLSYFEIEIVTITGTINVGAVPTSRRSDYNGTNVIHNPNGVSWQSNDTVLRNGATLGASGLGSWSDGDIIMVAVCSGSKQIWFGKNGTWDNSTVTPGGTDATTSLVIVQGAYHIALSMTASGDEVNVRFSNTEFSYSPPGFFQGPHEAEYEVENPAEVAGGAGNPDWDNVVFLGQWEDTNGATPTPDETGNVALTYNGTCAVSNAQAKFGSTSLFVDENDDITVAPEDIGPLIGDFTIETWFWSSNFFSTSAIIGDFRFLNNGTWALERASGNVVNFKCRNSTTMNGCTGTTAMSTSTWHHIAVTRDGDTLRIFLDGTLEDTLTGVKGVAINWNDSSVRDLKIGTDNQGAEIRSGHLEDLRITKGVALYTGNFTVPSGAFPTS